MRTHPTDHLQHTFSSLIVSSIVTPARPTYLTRPTEVREQLKGKDLSFTEIAKTVGERWQVLAPDDKATYESRSQAMKDRYYAELAEYKKTQDYAHYQNYLEDFKAKHEPTSKFLILLARGSHRLTFPDRWQTLEGRQKCKPKPTEQRRENSEQPGPQRRLRQQHRTAWRHQTVIDNRLATNHKHCGLATNDALKSHLSRNHNSGPEQQVSSKQQARLCEHQRPTIKYASTHALSTDQRTIWISYAQPPHGHQHKYGIRVSPHAHHPKLLQLATNRPPSQTHIA